MAMKGATRLSVAQQRGAKIGVRHARDRIGKSVARRRLLHAIAWRNSVARQNKQGRRRGATEGAFSARLGGAKPAHGLARRGAH